MNSPDPFRPRRDIPRRIYDALVKEQARRRENPRWIKDEMMAYLRAVNAEREALGKPPVALKDVEDAERGALGHTDYTTKCAYAGERLVEAP